MLFKLYRNSKSRGNKSTRCARRVPGRLVTSDLATKFGWKIGDTGAHRHIHLDQEGWSQDYQFEIVGHLRRYRHRRHGTNSFYINSTTSTKSGALQWQRPYFNRHQRPLSRRAISKNMDALFPTPATKPRRRPNRAFLRATEANGGHQLYRHFDVGAVLFHAVVLTAHDEAVNARRNLSSQCSKR